jgi:hypothetical protein
MNRYTIDSRYKDHPDLKTGFSGPNNGKDLKDGCGFLLNWKEFHSRF